MKTQLRAALLISAMIVSANSAASTRTSELFGPDVRIGEQVLTLRGSATYEYLLWTLYSAALYLPATASGAAALGDVPRSLELVYWRSISARDIVRAADAVLERSLSSGELAAIRARVEALHAAYVDVHEGDRYTLTYAPGGGTSLRLNGKLVLSIPGADFASAYFGVWLGKQPLDEDLREALLGNSARSTS